MSKICKHTFCHTKPSEWVKKYIKLLSRGDSVLDLACGSGRHTRLLLESGFKVTALDCDISKLKGVEETRNLKTLEHDLEGVNPWPFAPCIFDGIIVTNYLHRPLFLRILDSLAPKGILIYQTFALGNEKFGRPRNPQYLLLDDELLNVFGGQLRVVNYSHGFNNRPSPAIMQSICCINDK